MSLSKSHAITAERPHKSANGSTTENAAFRPILLTVLTAWILLGAILWITAFLVVAGVISLKDLCL